MAKRSKDKKSKSKFKYQRRSKDDVKAAANQRAGNFDSIIKDGFKVYKVREGKNLIRILPPTWEDARHYAYTLMVNYGIGADNQSYLSLHHMLNKPDPLEEARRDAAKEGDEKLAKALEAKKRSGVWVIDRFDEEAGAQFFAMPFTLDRDISQMCYDEDSNEAVLVDDPDEGCDVRFYREGKGRNTKYPAAKMKIMKPSPIFEDEDQQAEVLEYITDNPIPDVLNYCSYEHIDGVFGGKAGRDDDDDDDDKKRNKRGKRRDDDDDDDEDDRKSKKSKSKSKGKSRDDDDDEDDEDDDDEDDRKSSKKSKSKSKSRDDDDDDDDDDEDDDDDSSDDDDDDDDEDDDDDDDRKSNKSKSSKGKSSKRRDEDDDDDDDEDEDDDDEDDRKSSKKDSAKTRADRIKERLNKARDKRKRD